MSAQEKTLSQAMANTPGLVGNFSTLVLASNIGTPTNSTSTTVSSGTIWVSGDYLYVAVSDNVVKRAQLASF